MPVRLTAWSTKIFCIILPSPFGWVRYGTDCTDFVAHGRVVTPWNGMTIPRRYALPCTPKPHTPPRPTAGFRIIVKLCEVAGRNLFTHIYLSIFCSVADRRQRVFVFFQRLDNNSAAICQWMATHYPKSINLFSAILLILWSNLIWHDKCFSLASRMVMYRIKMILLASRNCAT